MPRVYSNGKLKILEATERVILRDGPRGVSIDAVLRESGMSKGGFFHHFATKEALLGALIERLSSANGEKAATSTRREPRPAPRSLRAQVALAFDMLPVERERTRALVLTLISAVMESPAVAAHARVANEQALELAEGDGVDVGVALVVQFALDGYFLGDTFGTVKLGAARKAAIRATLLSLIEGKKVGRRASRD